MRRVAIIGAGIAGLASAVYASKSGFEVDVFEAHTIPGGLCTSWKREGFVFDGCIHYLFGTSPESPFYRLWEEVGALDNRVFAYPDVLASATDLTGRTATLYSDIARLEEHLCQLSPEDRSLSREFCRLIRTVSRFPAPVEQAPELMNLFDIARVLWSVRPVAREWSYCLGTSIENFVGGFRDPLLRELLKGTMDPRSPLLNLVSTLSGLANRSAGYPIGGSLPFARAIETRLLELGGRVHYRKRVTGLAVQRRCVKGLEFEDGSTFDADFVIASGDLRATLNLLDRHGFRSPGHERLFRDTKIAAPALQISIGLNRRFSSAEYVVANQIQLSTPVSVAGQSIEWLTWSHHDHDPTLAPPGCSVVTSLIPTDFDAWDRLGLGTPAYRDAKRSIAESVINHLDARFQGFSQAVQVVDVATPLTFQRYCGTYRGSYMSWLGPIQSQRIHKQIPRLGGLLLTGMWVGAPGGLPVVLKTGRDAIQILCRKVGVPFQGQ